jgi:hypothetical protein
MAFHQHYQYFLLEPEEGCGDGSLGPYKGEQRRIGGSERHFGSGKLPGSVPGAASVRLRRHRPLSLAATRELRYVFEVPENGPPPGARPDESAGARLEMELVCRDVLCPGATFVSALW